MKKFAVLLLVLAMVFSFAACGGEKSPEEQTTEQVQVNEDLTDTVGTDSTAPSETEAATEGEAETTELNEEESSTEEATVLDADPANWTDEQIVSVYKAAARKTHPHVTSVQTMTMRELVVNDDDGADGRYSRRCLFGYGWSRYYGCRRHLRC